MEVESELLDWYLRVGVAAAQIGRLSHMRPDLEIRLRNGLLTLGYAGKDPTYRAGTMFTEPTDDNWQSIADAIATFPKEE